MDAGVLARPPNDVDGEDDSMGDVDIAVFAGGSPGGPPDGHPDGPVEAAPGPWRAALYAEAAESMGLAAVAHPYGGVETTCWDCAAARSPQCAELRRMQCQRVVVRIAGAEQGHFVMDACHGAPRDIGAEVVYVGSPIRTSRICIDDSQRFSQEVGLPWAGGRSACIFRLR